MDYSPALPSSRAKAVKFLERHAICQSLKDEPRVDYYFILDVIFGMTGNGSDDESESMKL